MNPAESNRGKVPCDAFLCHNNTNKKSVREIHEALTKRGLRVWLDEREITPGTTWLPVLEQAIRTTRAGIIVIGAGGLVRWAEAERQVLEEESVERGIPIVPVLLEGSPEWSELPAFLRRHQWIDLRRGLDEDAVESLVAALRRGPGAPPPGPPSPRPLYLLHDVPALPPEYQDRAEHQLLKEKLLAWDERPVTVLGLHGMGGVGKTMLAAALANDPEVQRAFPHGIFWFTLGREATTERLKGLQEQWIQALSGSLSVPADLEQGKDRLRALLRDRACLLVLDDVWDAEHAEAFTVLGRLGKLLLTSRSEKVARRLGAEPDLLGELPPEEGLLLLARYAGTTREALPPEALEVARECGHLPLALAMAGSMVRGRPADRWGNVLERFRRSDLDSIEALFPGTPHRTLLRAIEVSVKALPETEAVRYLELAIFPEDTALPEEALRAYFAPAGLGPYQVQDLVDTFVSLSLARRDREGRIQLHDLQHDYVRRLSGDLLPLHERLLDGYRSLAAKGWHTGPNDGYFFQQLSRHLVAAGRQEELRLLLLDPCWLSARLHAAGIQDLLGDFERLGVLGDPPLRLLRDALRLSSHVLAGQPEQLAAQLLGRLGGVEHRELSGLLERLEIPPAVLRPLWPSLGAPGGPLLRVIPHHKHWISTVALTPDGRTAMSGEFYANSVKVWDLGRGTLLWALEAHRDDIWSVAISADGLTGISASRDGTICVWNLESGMLVHELKRHGGLARKVALTPDGRLAASGGDDGRVELWDVLRGSLRASADLGTPIWRVALSAGGTLLACCSEQGQASTFAVEESHLRRLCTFQAVSYRLWLSPDGARILVPFLDEVKEFDPQSGALRSTWQNRAWRDLDRSPLTIAGPGYLAVATTRRRVVEIWDPEAEHLLTILQGHNLEVLVLDVTPDGRTAITGGADYDLMVWDLGVPAPTQPDPKHEDSVDALLISSDSKRIFSLSKDSLREWDLASGRLHANHPVMIAWSDAVLVEEGRLAVTTYSDPDVAIWDLQTRTRVGSLHHQDRVNCVSATPNGGWIVSGSNDRTVLLWDLRSRALSRRFTGHGELVKCVTITPDGRWIASGDLDGRVNVFEAKRSEPLHSFETHEGVSAVALTPDGRHLCSASTDGFVSLWDLETGSYRGFVESSEPGTVRKLALSPDARRLFVCCLRTVTAVDLSTGRVARFIADAGFACLAAAPGGGLIAGDSLGRVHHLTFASLTRAGGRRGMPVSC